MSFIILMDENLQEREKAVLKIFSMMKFFKHDVTYRQFIN